VRRGLVVLVFALLSPAPAGAATLTLDHAPRIPRYGAEVTFSGTGASPGETIRLFIDGSFIAGQRVVADGSGNYTLPALPAVQPGDYEARGSGGETSTSSLKLRPILTRRMAGLRYPGNRLVLKGRLRPANAASLTLKVGTHTRRVRVHGDGHYTAPLPTSRIGRHRARLIVEPKPGYKGYVAVKRFRILAPSLSSGARGTAVLALERRLVALKHVLRDKPNRYYATDTYEAVLAFQKVHRMARTGRASRAVWAALGRARVPRPRVAKGNHVEVSKTLQVMYEVRSGKVVRIVHVSTGATGNTPVGRWHVYSKVPGLLPDGMYYSNFFTGAFAIHGYASVPPWPASHGCVRTPMWFAPGFYARWSVGTTVYIFA
jgi:hypothetical protein